MKMSLKLIYRMNLWVDSHQSNTGVPLGQFKRVDFVLVTLTLFQGQSLICRISLELMDGFFQTYIDVPLGQALELIRFW